MSARQPSSRCRRGGPAKSLLRPSPSRRATRPPARQRRLLLRRRRVRLPGGGGPRRAPGRRRRCQQGRARQPASATPSDRGDPQEEAASFRPPRSLTYSELLSTWRQGDRRRRRSRKWYMSSLGDGTPQRGDLRDEPAADAVAQGRSRPDRTARRSQQWTGVLPSRGVVNIGSPACGRGACLRVEDVVFAELCRGEPGFLACGLVVGSDAQPEDLAGAIS